MWRGEPLAGDEARPLSGRRIVITRAPEQSGEITRRLQDLGAEVILLPMVRFVDLEDTSDLDRAIARLGEFDWLVFTSANAVTVFLSRCCELDRWAALRWLSIATVGSATLAALEQAKLHATLTPSEFGGAALAADLAPRLAGKRVLLPRSDRASEELPAALRAAGAAVTEVVAYRTAGPDLADGAALDAIRRGEADAIAFFSPSAVHNFVRATGRDTLPSIAESTAFAAIGPTTAAAIRAAGLPVAVEASTATAEGLAEALAIYFVRSEAETGRMG